MKKSSSPSLTVIYSKSTLLAEKRVKKSHSTVLVQMNHGADMGTRGPFEHIIIIIMLCDHLPSHMNFYIHT